jgi:hypothetical protein
MLTIFRHIVGFRDPDRFDPGEKFSDMTTCLLAFNEATQKVWLGERPYQVGLVIIMDVRFLAQLRCANELNLCRNYRNRS